MGVQKVGHDLATEQQQQQNNLKISGVRSHDVCIISHLSLLLKNYSQALSLTLSAKTTLKESRKREE